ncbi:SIP domain-containing protein [Pseudonocardia saturnea]
MAQHRLRTHPLVLRRVEVARVVDVTPHMRRVTVVGPELATFTRDGIDLPAFVNESFDDHLKLIFAADGDIAAALPVQRARSIDWPPSEHRQGRDYTPRRFDPVSGELDLDVVLHGDGPGAEWARTARPGDALHFAGPKSSLVLPDDVDWMLLAGDETALPAIGRFLDDRPVDVPVQVVVEVRYAAARQDLPLLEGDTLRWVVTPDGAPSALAAAVRELVWWPGRAYAWAAGESRSLLPLRRHLRRELQLPPTHVDVTGYWHADPAPVAAEVPKTDPAALLDPLPWIATRAAVQLGLLDALGEVPVPAAELAIRLAVDAGALRAVTGYLATIDVLRADGDAVALGPVGEELLGDDHLRDELFGAGVEARTLDALLQIAPALQAGEAPWHRVAGRSLAEEADADAAVYADRVAEAGGFAFVAGGVPDHPAWAGAGRITVTGPGALALVGAARDRGPLPDVVVSAPAVPLRVLEELGAGLPVTFATLDAARPADVVVSTLELGHRTDVELVAHLTALAAHADHALLVDALAHNGPGGRDATAEHDLRTLAATGRGRRRAGDVEQAAAAAGWRWVGAVPIGWDHEVYELRR